MKISVFALLLLLAVALDGQSQPAAQQPQTNTAKTEATSTEPHDNLATLVGQWAATTKFTDAAPLSESGNVEVKTILGGKFIWMETKGSTGTGSFTKVKIVGYDNIDRKYQTTWMSDQQNDMIQLKGVSDSGKMFTFLGGYHDAEGKAMILRAVLTITDKDHFAWECFRMEQNGKPTKILEVAYARRK